MNNRFFYKLILTCFLISVSTLSFSQTLKDAIIQTIETNPDVLINVKNWMASEKGIKGAQAGFFPVVDAIAKFGHESINNDRTGFETKGYNQEGYGISLRENLFKGFETVSEVSRNKSRTIADVYQTEGYADDIALLAVKAYLEVLRTQKIVELAEDNYKAHENIYGMIKKRAETGLGRQADTAQSYGRLSLAKANLLSSQSNYRDAVTVYDKVIGRMPNSLFIPRGPMDVDLPNDERTAIQIALIEHPTLKAANSDVKEAIAQYNATKSKNYPSLDAVFDAFNYEDFDGDNDEYRAILELRYNLFRGGLDLARQKETAILIKKAEEIRNRTHIQVIESMKLSWNSLQTSRDQLNYFKKYRNASRVTLNSYRKQFTLGKRTLLDLLDAENELFSSEIKYVDARINFLFSKFRVLNSAGRILPYMGIKMSLPKEKLNIHMSTWSPKYPPANLYKFEEDEDIGTETFNNEIENKVAFEGILSKKLENKIVKKEPVEKVGVVNKNAKKKVAEGSSAKKVTTKNSATYKEKVTNVIKDDWGKALSVIKNADSNV